MGDKERTARRVHFLCDSKEEKLLLDEVAKKRGHVSAGAMCKVLLYKYINNYEKGFNESLHRMIEASNEE